MRYQLIAIDLDGTLLDGSGSISRSNCRAIATAEAQGILVVPCTGRAWREAKAELSVLPNLTVGVFVTGAAVVDLPGGRIVDLAVIDPDLAGQIVEHLYDLPDAVLVFCDATLAGHDYLVTGHGQLTANTQWWFERCGSTVHYLDRPTANDLRHALRIGVVAPQSRITEVVETLGRRFANRVCTHCFQAIQLVETGEVMYVLEVFAAGVDKWRGLELIARERAIEPARIAAIGDQVNDLAMIRGAGCGIAMGNAVEGVKQAADHVTLDCGADGVAAAVEQLLAGTLG